VLQCVAMCCNVLQCVAVCCSLLQSVAVCCSLQPNSLALVSAAAATAGCRSNRTSKISTRGSEANRMKSSVLKWSRVLSISTLVTLQHTATHGNALQRTAMHCHALQRTATHCNTLQHSATHCNTLQHTVYICIAWQTE